MNRQDYAQAIDAFDEAIQRTEAEMPNLKDWVRSQGEAYLTLGNSYYEKGLAKEKLGDSAASQVLYKTAADKYAECVKFKAFEKTLAQGAAARCERYQIDVNARIKK